MRKISLFRTMIIMLAMVLALRGFELWRIWPEAEAADAETASVEAENTSTDQTPSAIETEDMPKTEAPTKDNSCPGGKDFTLETGLSQYEMQLLRSLAKRREALDARAENLDTREKIIAAAGFRLDEQIGQLRKLEANMQTVLSNMEVRNNERMNGLVRVYEAMKPKDAARIFDTLDNQILLDVAVRMKHAALSAILARMTSDRAKKLTAMMVEQVDIPDSIEELQEQDG